MLLLLVVISFSSASGAAYEGQGQVYFTHRYQDTKSGVRAIYRPDKYELYSPLGEGTRAIIGYFGRQTESETRAGYEFNVINNVAGWPVLTWDTQGKYYYNDNDQGGIVQGMWLGYAVHVYNSADTLIYKDTYHFYQVPSNLQYCEIDETASNGVTSCSTVLVTSGGSGGCGIHGSSAGVYEGEGQVYFTLLDRDTKSGIRTIYRPDNYECYSPLGVGAKAIMGYHGKPSESEIRAKYDSIVINSVNLWPSLTWDASGNYYYHDNNQSYKVQGMWLGYAVHVYNSSNALVYKDTYHFYQVPSSLQYCEIDERAGSGDTKCSSVFSVSGGSASFNSAGAIIAVMLAVKCIVA